MLAIAQWRCGLKIDNAIVLGKVLHYYGKLLYYGQILVCRENRSPRENFDTRYDNTSKSFPGFWERGWDTLIEVMPPFHQRLSEPFNTLLLEKKWKKNNNSTIMESTEFTNAFFICHASSHVLDYLLRVTLSVNRVTNMLDNLYQSHLDLLVGFDVQPRMLVIFSVPTEIKKGKRL